MRNNLSAYSPILDIPRDIAARDRAARFSDRFVSASMVRVVCRIDKVANWPLRKRPDRSQDLVSQRRILGVHDQDAVAADLHCDVAAGANDHVYIALRRKNVNLYIIQVLVLLCERKT